MASYTVNKAAVERARRLIDARQYVLDSDWGQVQPGADAQNAFLRSHSWEEYAEWHLGLTEGATEDTKARHAFVYGDFRRVHRTALIACVYRASEWRHKDVELAAHDPGVTDTASTSAVVACRRGRAATIDDRACDDRVDGVPSLLVFTI